MRKPYIRTYSGLTHSYRTDADRERDAPMYPTVCGLWIKFPGKGRPSQHSSERRGWESDIPTTCMDCIARENDGRKLSNG